MAVHTSVNGTTAIPWKSSRKSKSVIEQLRGCQEAWCPGPPWDREEAHAALRGTPAGSFLVVQGSSASGPGLLCVSAGGDGTVVDFDIKHTATALHLSESRLSFSDAAQLVLFYSLTRDVLPVCLSIPRWIFRVNEKNRQRLSQLEPKTWLSVPADQQSDEMSSSEPSNNIMCSIQLTSTNGALCIINPLYLREHGDDWLTNKAQYVSQPAGYRRERRLSTTRTWTGAGLQNKRTVSLDQEPSAASLDSAGLSRARSTDSPPQPQSPAAPAGVVLRRPSRDSPFTPPFRTSTVSLSSSTPSTSGSVSSTVSEVSHQSSPIPSSPHRVSWIEDGVWLPPPRPSSLLRPPSLEPDSLSISSIEEDLESPQPNPSSHYPSAQRLADKVLHRFSAVGQALGGLVCQRKRLANRVQELSERRGEHFGDAVKGFVETTLKRGADPGGVTVLLQEVRSSLTSVRETLLDCHDIQGILDSITDLNDLEIDTLVELSLHRVALKPVSTHLYSCIHASRTEDGTFKRLQSNVRVLEKKGMEELGGSAGVGVPDAVTLEKIQHRWTSMHESYSPNKKVQSLLKVCKSIYHSMSANATSGKVFGADDFLPCLTWVLLRSDVVTLQQDTDYMMELLDPTQLQGEGGYYLTTLYAALYYISSFQPRLAARQLSVEAQNSLDQWHRRRTLHCNQSRRSKHRRTIRRQQRGTQATETRRGSGEEGKTQVSWTETGSEEESGKESDSVSFDKVQQQTESIEEALQPLKEETRS